METIEKKERLSLVDQIKNLEVENTAADSGLERSEELSKRFIFSRV